MNLSWSVLALALIGVQDQQPSQPKTPNPPIPIEIDIRGPQTVGGESCRQAATAIVVESDSRTTTARMSRVMARLVDRCIERCVDLVVDEAKAAIVAKLTEPPGIATKPDKKLALADLTLAAVTQPPGVATKPATVTSDAASSAPPKDLLNSNLPMKLPKMAKPRTVNDPEATEAWPMTIQEATRIALDNSEVVRVIAFGTNHSPIGCAIDSSSDNSQPIPGDASPNRVVISCLNADVTPWRFKAEIMAQVRSVEQTYWSLAQVHVQLWAADRAVSLAKEILKREEADLTLSRGTVAEVAEAAQRLEQFQLDLVTRTSDVITTERQLRNLLGLPPADNRRIIPVTPPSEQRIEYDWDTCLGEMMENQPDIVQQKLLVRVAELRLLLARNQLIPPLDLETLDQLCHLGQQLDSSYAFVHQITLNLLNPVLSQPEKVATPDPNLESAKGFTTWQIGHTFQMPLATRSPLANSRQAQYMLLRSNAYLHQIEHQTTHSLARFFLEVDANYKQYKTSSRLRSSAAQRLDAQRAFYEEGRITIDRFLDAVSQYATAVATEAQYKFNLQRLPGCPSRGQGDAARGSGHRDRRGSEAAESVCPGHQACHVSADPDADALVDTGKT